jgi:hypothetical protein
MIRGAVVVYGSGGHLSHILEGTPGRWMERGADLDLCEFAGVYRRCARADLSPARLWWRKGPGKWQGPFRSYRAAMAALRLVAGDWGEVESALRHGRATPAGAETISGGWRYRLAWGGETPPLRHG